MANIDSQTAMKYRTLTYNIKTTQNIALSRFLFATHLKMMHQTTYIDILSNTVEYTMINIVYLKGSAAQHNIQNEGHIQKCRIHDVQYLRKIKK